MLLALMVLLVQDIMNQKSFCIINAALQFIAWITCL